MTININDVSTRRLGIEISLEEGGFEKHKADECIGAGGANLLRRSVPTLAKVDIVTLSMLWTAEHKWPVISLHPEELVIIS